MSVVDLTSLPSLFETHKVSLEGAYLIAEPDDLEAIASNEFDGEWIADFLPPGEEPLEPVSDIYYPLVEDAADAFSLFGPDREYNASDHKLGGVISLSIYWRDMLRNILPKGTSLEKSLASTLRALCNFPYLEA